MKIRYKDEDKNIDMVVDVKSSGSDEIRKMLKVLTDSELFVVPSIFQDYQDVGLTFNITVYADDVEIQHNDFYLFVKNVLNEVKKRKDSAEVFAKPFYRALGVNPFLETLRNEYLPYAKGNKYTITEAANLADDRLNQVIDSLVFSVKDKEYPHHYWSYVEVIQHDANREPYYSKKYHRGEWFSDRKQVDKEDLKLVIVPYQPGDEKREDVAIIISDNPHFLKGHQGYANVDVYADVM